MGILMLHDAIPHVHNETHNHHATQGVVSDSDQLHHHHHHHSDQDVDDQGPGEESPNEESRGDLIQIFREIHAQGYHVHDLVESRRPATWDLSNCSSYATGLAYDILYRLSNADELDHANNVWCKPKLYLVNSALRAPPFLG